MEDRRVPVITEQEIKDFILRLWPRCSADYKFPHDRKDVAAVRLASPECMACIFVLWKEDEILQSKELMVDHHLWLHRVLVGRNKIKVEVYDAAYNRSFLSHRLQLKALQGT